MDAPLTLVEYASLGGIDDAFIEDVIRDVRGHFGQELRFVYRHNTLDDPAAEQAALAIEAVNAQSQELFPLMRQELSRLCMDEELDRNVLRRAAVDVGANLTNLEEAMRHQQHIGQVRDDTDDAKTLGLDRSPAFFVNGEIYEGPVEADDIIAALEAVEARSVPCDLLDAESARDVLEGIVRDEETVDALVITVGVVMSGSLASRDVEDWVRGFSTDTMPALRAVRSLLPALRAAATAKGIADIVVGSIASNTAFEDAVVYGAAAARHALGEQHRVELRTERIRARTIAAGFTATPLNAGREHEIPAVIEQIVAAPLRPEDVATVVHHGINLSPDVTVHDVVMVPTSQGWA